MKKKQFTDALASVFDHTPAAVDLERWMAGEQDALKNGTICDVYIIEDTLGHTPTGTDVLRWAHWAAGIIKATGATLDQVAVHGFALSDDAEGDTVLWSLYVEILVPVHVYKGVIA
jgi:hypothetical protein